MPAALSYPGVYVEERSSGARAIAGVATSICAFVGMTERGRMDVPRRVTSFAAFDREFGATSTGEMADQVRQFFLNGGGDAYVCRIADGEKRASVVLRNEANDADSMTITARDSGAAGNRIGIEIDYNTPNPERTFNLRAFRNVVVPSGPPKREEMESFGPLSMDPDSPFYVVDAIEDISALIEVTPAPPPAAVRGVSMAGLVVPNDATALATLTPLVAAGRNRIQVQVGNGRPALATLRPLTALGDVATLWTADIDTALNGAATVTVALEPGGAADSVTGGRLITVISNDGAVVITPAPGADATAGLMLGEGAGGIEGDTYGDLRPAPTSMTSRVGKSATNFPALRAFAGLGRDSVTGFVLDDDSPVSQHLAPFVLGGPERMYDVGATRSLNNVRAALGLIAAGINDNVAGLWKPALVHNRIVLQPRYAAERENAGAGALLTTGTTNLGAAGGIFAVAANVRAYSVGLPDGIAGTPPFQTGATLGENGDFPKNGDYDQAFRTIEQEVDLFNLMVLPRAAGQSDDDRAGLWGLASAFCAQQRAFLIVDPRADWTNIDAAEAGADAIRVGVETRNAACYFPRLRANDPAGGVKVIDPAGSVAGVMARTDARRGIWKAPAGLESTIRGIRGVERQMSDPDNGRINPLALNGIRLFSAGVVVWGARSLVGFNSSGNIDDKYVPVRRTMLFIEESLSRGLAFAIFEPNDEPLWAQIRLAAGSFMNSLFRQGAFAGAKSSDAYFVVCDATTTTATDINLGVVNVIVGFAPLKPAEFVVLTVTQMAGQVQI